MAFIHDSLGMIHVVIRLSGLTVDLDSIQGYLRTKPQDRVFKVDVSDSFFGTATNVRISNFCLP